MPDPWIDDHSGDETSPRDGFRDEFRSTLAKGLGRRRVPWSAVAWIVAAVAAVALLATTFATTRDRHVQPATPPTSVAAATTTPGSTPETVPGGIDSTTTEVTLLLPSGPAISAADLVDTTWTLASIDASSAVNSKVSFSLRPDGSLTGEDGCNSYGFAARSWTVTGNRLELRGPLESTAVQCSVSGVMPLSSAHVNGLTLDSTGARLTITNTHVYVVTRPPRHAELTVGLSNLPITPANGTVLATIGVDQLGFEQCSECQAAHPAEPLVTADGTIVIADNFNKRWAILRSGNLSYIPLAPNTQWVGQPVLIGGLIYSPEERHTASGGRNNVIAGYETSDLTNAAFVADVPELTYADPEITLNGDQVLASGIEVMKVAPPLAAPTLSLRFGETPPAVDVTWKGVTTTMTFVSGTVDVSMVTPLLQATRDGSVYLVAPVSRSGTVDLGQLLVRVHPDGHATATKFRGLPSGQITDQGFTQLESDGNGHLNVVHYDLPA